MKHPLHAGLILAAFLLAGCSSLSNTERAQAGFLSVSELIGEYQVAIAGKYLACHDEAQTVTAQTACYDAKQERVEELDEAILYFYAYGDTLIALGEAPPDGTALGNARRILAALLPQLREQMDTQHSQAVAWVEGD